MTIPAIPGFFPMGNVGQVSSGVYANSPEALQYVTITKEDGRTIWQWDSPQDLARYMIAVGKAWPYIDTGRQSWTNGASLTDAVRMSLEGWQEGADKLKASTARADAAVMGTSPEVTTYADTSGAYVDVDAFLSGEPECMTEFAVAPVEVRRLRILVDFWISGGCSTREIEERGTCIASAILALQAMGILVEVIGTMSYRATHGEGLWDFRVPIWESGKPFDSSILAACLTHTGWVRQLLFNAQCWAAGNVMSGISNGGDSRFNMIPHKPGDVKVSGMLLGRHSWTGPEANKLFLGLCLDAAAKGAGLPIPEDEE